MEKREMPNEVLLGAVEQMLDEGREVVITPKGNSMLPFIRGDRDSVRLQKKDSLEIGDIVLVNLGNRYILHRIIAIDGDNVTLMGDGNVKGTEACRRESVCGTVTGIQRDGKMRNPGKGRLWGRLLPVRRYLLAIRRRLPGKWK